jgi:hypothetical protein
LGAFIGLAARLGPAAFLAPAWAAFLAAPAFLASSAWAGAWTPDEGHGEIIVTTLFDEANSAFNQVGRFTPTPLYRSLQASAFVDYGVTDWLALLVKPSVQSSSLGPPADQRYTGLGNSEMGAQARLWRDDTAAVALQANLIAPTTAGPVNSWLAGSRSAAFDLRLLLGKNIAIGSWPGFVDLSEGVRLRGGPAPNEAHVDLTLGLYATPRLLLLAQSFNIVSGPSSNPNYPQWTQSKAQFSLVYSLNDDWRVQLGGFTTLAGQNAYRENGALFAVWWKF